MRCQSRVENTLSNGMSGIRLKIRPPEARCRRRSSRDLALGSPISPSPDNGAVRHRRFSDDHRRGKVTTKFGPSRVLRKRRERFRRRIESKVNLVVGSPKVGRKTWLSTLPGYTADDTVVRLNRHGPRTRLSRSAGWGLCRCLGSKVIRGKK